LFFNSALAAENERSHVIAQYRVVYPCFCIEPSALAIVSIVGLSAQETDMPITAIFSSTYRWRCWLYGVDFSISMGF